MTNTTVDYYESNAKEFYLDTVDIDMSAIHDKFLAGIPKGGLILDAGCGSGRDSNAFIYRGFRVKAFDASPELALLATQLIGQQVAVRTFAQVDEIACYDGIWACASVLHLPEQEISNTFKQLWHALKPNGILYVSFKKGEGERTDTGRQFTDATQTRIENWLTGLPDIDSMDFWTTEEQRPSRNEIWLNALINRKTSKTNKLLTGELDHAFLPQLSTAIAEADEIEFAVAFVKATGLRLLLPELQNAISRSSTTTQQSARLRVVTSDYLDITDPEALRLLMLLQEKGAQVRVFETNGQSFHMKAYLFAQFNKDYHLKGTAFIGSSNISREALTDGLEWNYRVDFPGDNGFLEARTRFEDLFCHRQTVLLTDEWIDQFEERRIPPQRAIAPGSQEKEPPPTPTPVQVGALAALKKTRDEGFMRGLVVMATGLGKTWLAAFDAEQLGAHRVLFVAHREEILNQAAETFLRIRPRARIGLYMGKERETRVDILCASVQTLGRASHFARFSPHHFDYIIIDEFHHAAAPTYRHLLNYFTPRFMLGLTATPDRTDQSDILSFCDDNLVFSCNLFSGINADLLAPFHYFGIWDTTVDYEAIPWRNGRFDPEQLSNKLATLARARHAFRQWREKGQRRTLAFCASTRHAEYMADQFQHSGVATAAVYSGSIMKRCDALTRLDDGRLQVIFTVDLFNEGVDLPSIDTVLMLRPTESKILFLQQLGRGLRKAPGKDKLVVLDFIGNHQGFLHKPQALAQVGPSYRQLAEFARQVESKQLLLPNGCFISYDLELIDFLKSLDSDSIAKEYEALRGALDRRPTLAEFYRAGSNVTRVRQQYGCWFEFVQAMGDLSESEINITREHGALFREVELTPMTKSFKMVLLEAFQELDGWQSPPTLVALAQRSWQLLQRHRAFLMDLPDNMHETADGASAMWQRYWQQNPVNAWTGASIPDSRKKILRSRRTAFQAHVFSDIIIAGSFRECHSGAYRLPACCL
ncbi:DEAD/DEAH box helicase family protein [Synechococcus sp. 1G10]|uniref:DEAD/DEAH box helicase family protein n=1 Tax=Synechococcus sp. 1G10 TaxID=2025605 RepID=UPI0018E957E0|nr:DEAD/DEAH box helicase family protein [Synechococcus sp. 1G10]